MGKALPPPAREGRRVLKAASGRDEDSYRPGGARRSMPYRQQGAPVGAVIRRNETGLFGTPGETGWNRVADWPRPF